jgi:dimethylhistidine N-methyltransferase
MPLTNTSSTLTALWKTPSVLKSRLQIRHFSPSDCSHIPVGQDVIQGLTQSPKVLSPQYFYDDRGSQLFEQICELPEYYPTRTEDWILQHYAPAIAQCTGACELVELGSGSSTKTRRLLDAYQQQHYPLHYQPIDVSAGILTESAERLLTDYPTLKVRGLVGTYEQALTELPPAALTQRMIFFLGSTLGNFTPSACDRFMAQIATVLDAGDYFLLGIDLQKPRGILEPAYNDSQGVTAAFNLNMLSHLNWRFCGNFDPDLFSHQAIYNEVDSQIEMYLHCHKDHQVSLSDLNLTVSFQAGESTLTEISRKFDLVTIQTQLASHGLNPIQTWTDPQQWFGLMLCQA